METQGSRQLAHVGLHGTPCMPRLPCILWLGTGFIQFLGPLACTDGLLLA